MSYIERAITPILKKRVKSSKCVLITGARQVGKTYILKEFGKENYENIAYFNFDHDEALKELFLNFDYFYNNFNYFRF